MSRNRSGAATVQRAVLRRLALLLVPVALLVPLAACGDDDGDDVDSGAPDVGEPAATFVGTITQVTAFEPVTEDCTPPEDLDPDGSVSSDDPPICTDPETAPLGSILVEVEPGVDGGEKIVFTIRQDTALTRAGEPIGFDQLTEGAEATIGFNGQVAESYPGQATADEVEVAG